MDKAVRNRNLTRNLSGEWLIGGVEAKGFAYLALLLAIVAVCERAFRRAGIAIGLAISLHPVVGLWGALGLAAALGSSTSTTLR